MQARTLFDHLPGGRTVAVNGELLRLRWRYRGIRSYEPDAWTRLLDLIEPGERFVDVGGNIGLYTIAAARRGARVTVFEPDPAAARDLRHHLRLNGTDATLVEAAAGSAAGEILMSLQGDLESHTTAAGAPVPCVRLDEVIEACDVLKIDVEGAELAVLQGAERLHPHTILVELHDVDDERIRVLLEQRGYAVEVLLEAPSRARWLARLEPTRG